MRTLTACVLLAALLAVSAAQAAEIGKIANEPIRDTGNVFVNSTTVLDKKAVYYLVKDGSIVAQLKPVTIVKGVGAVMQINPKTAVNQVRVGDVVMDSAGGAAPAPGVAAPIAPVAPAQPTPVVTAPAAPFVTQSNVPAAPFVVPGQQPPAPVATPATAPAQPSTAPVDTGSPFVVQPGTTAPVVEPTAPVAPMAPTPAPSLEDSPFRTIDAPTTEDSSPFVQQPMSSAPAISTTTETTGPALATPAPPAPTAPPTESSPFTTTGGTGFAPTEIEGVESTPPIPPQLN